jgi:hypothetical protein
LVAKIAGLVAKITGLVELIVVIAYDLDCIHEFTLGTEYQGLFWLPDVLSWVAFFYKNELGWMASKLMPNPFCPRYQNLHITFGLGCK